MLYYTFIQGGESVKNFMISRKIRKVSEVTDLSNLLSFEEIKAKKFYQIQKLLWEVQQDQKGLENQSPEKANEILTTLAEKWHLAMDMLKKGKVSDENANEAWKDILAEYYGYIDPDSFNDFVRGMRKDIKWDCELVEMKAAFSLAELGQDSGWDALEEIGLTGTLDIIKQKIKGRITNHELRSDPKKEDNVPIDFYVMLADIRKRGYVINGDVLLQEWAGVLKSIKEDNERKNHKE